ncbi:MAG: RluA family pseudouridine synthase [Candidatus Moraniibacteriota bacterium]
MEAKRSPSGEHIVEQGASGKRLDVFVAKLSRSVGLSRAAVREGIEKGLVSVNGETVREPAKRLRYGDRVVTGFTVPVPPELAPNGDLTVPVLYEDDDVLFVSKPAGMQMHPAGNDKTETLANWIAASRPDMQNVGDDEMRPGIVHRLDRNTSGVVVLAKTEESFRDLQEVFRSRKADKRYLALVIGHVKAEEGTIDTPIAHRTGTLRHQTVDNPETFDGKMKSAVSVYRLKHRYADFDLLEIRPKTGRTHQIRVHLTSIGHPVVGDHLYGGRRMRLSGMPDRQLLHASSLSFTLSGRTIGAEAPLPRDFADFLDSLDGNK